MFVITEHEYDCHMNKWGGVSEVEVVEKDYGRKSSVLDSNGNPYRLSNRNPLGFDLRPRAVRPVS